MRCASFNDHVRPRISNEKTNYGKIHAGYHFRDVDKYIARCLDEVNILHRLLILVIFISEIGEDFRTLVLLFLWFSYIIL